MTAFLTDNLNPAQREAVISTEGPTLVIAGPGSGKTRVIAHRIAWLIREKGAPAWRIFAATFTNKAAREMRDRVCRLLDTSSQARLSVSTFHSFCATVLRREAERAGLTPRFTILDESDQKAVMKKCLERLGMDTKTFTPSQALDRVGLAKIRLLGPEDAGDIFEGPRGDDYLAAYREYEGMLRANDAVDFDDLLMRVVQLLANDADVRAHYQERFHYLMVDEYQDTNLAQFRLVELLAGERSNVCVVGDEDQSIYSWRGAEIENLLNFPKRYPGAKIIRLEQNYRSTKTILAAAETVIRRNTQRLGKSLFTELEEGEPVVIARHPTAQHEAAWIVREVRNLAATEGIAPAEMAVFYRVNSLSRTVEDALRAENLPYRVIGGIRFYDRMEIKDLLAYLQVVASPVANLALARIINTPKRGVGDKTLMTLERAALERGLSTSDALDVPEILNAVPKKARGALEAFRGQLAKWREKVDKVPISALLEEILEDTEYVAALGDPEALETIMRTQNIDELLGAIREYEDTAERPSLWGYLEQVALTAGVDEAREGEDVISLMTLHAAKGLEFRAVFLIGLEEGIFPSPRAMEEKGDVEEERRLFYVGMTRAKERLFLSWAETRMRFGQTDYMTPSIFLKETPEELCASVQDSDGRMAQRFLETRQWGPTPRGSNRRFRDADEWTTRKKASIPAPAYRPGMKVEHLFLGAGVVVAIEGEGEDLRLRVRFEDGEESEIIEKYGDLTILGM